ncbi:MAG: hypothetical protein OEO21_06470 [Candidatus Krumholzibacteria bacterium]|nr:hypothetical protein [Candidatus Krumholzibacteria bacterium]
MLIKTRRPRHSSKFSSRFRASSHKRQEYAATVYTMAAVKGMLAIVLAVAAVQAFRAVDVHAADLPLPIKLALPVALAAGGLLSLRACVRNFQEGREIWRRRREPPADH